MAAIFWLWVSWVLFCLGLVMAAASVYAEDGDELQRAKMSGVKSPIESLSTRVEGLEKSLFYRNIMDLTATDDDVAAANRIADIMTKQWQEIRAIHEQRMRVR